MRKGPKRSRDARPDERNNSDDASANTIKRLVRPRSPSSHHGHDIVLSFSEYTSMATTLMFARGSAVPVTAHRYRAALAIR